MHAYKTSAGAWQLNFCENGRQKTLYLGRNFTAAAAERTAKIITETIACRKRGESLPADLLQKIETFPLRIRENMERIGLNVDTGARTLSELISRYLDSIRHLKPKTILGSRYVGRKLTDYFGGTCLIYTVKPSDAMGFRSVSARSLSACTVSRNMRRCRTIFQFAVDSGWLGKNPFSKLGGGAEVNHRRQIYVNRQTVRRVMNACTLDADRLLLALARFGGLRIPSEIRHLRYKDFCGSVIRIHKDTKTGEREVPLFGEIREILECLQAAGGSLPDDLVFPGSFSAMRARLVVAIRRAGVPVWEKLFINLRSSCITDLDERRYSDVTMNAIFGNSAAVRNRHYVQFRREREYAKVLSDDEHLVKLFRSGECSDIPDDLLLQKIRRILELPEVLVGLFESEKKAS